MSYLQRIFVDGVEYSIALPHSETDYIQSGIVKGKTPYELAMLQDMASRLPRNSLVLDIGANVGNHSLYLAAVCGCRVHAFEPYAELCDAIKESISANQLSDKLFAYCCGVGAESAKAHFKQFKEHNLGGQALEVSEEGDGSIDVIRLDDLPWADGISAIKIDVEGMELKVLEGARSLIKRDLPLLYIECQSYDDYKSIQGWVADFGYGYLETFNATPTHLFAHESVINQGQRTQALIAKVLNQEYELKDELFNARRGLQQANLKYRDASESIKSLKDRLDSCNEERNLVEQSLAEANQKYRAVTASHIPELKEKLEKQTKHLRELQEKRAEAVRDLARVKSSRAYKVGLQLRATTASLPDAIKLPLRLWRTRRKVKNKIIAQPLPKVFSPSRNYESNGSDKVSREIKSKEINTKALVEKPARQLRVACIMDDFTFSSYQPECNLHQLTPNNWESELEDCQPDLLFIESAWRGKDDLWGSKVGHKSQELQSIVQWCDNRQVPTLLWNKEDPVHFETFLNTARIFDFIFTTDVDCIHRYKAALGHGNVYFLPFACQPDLNNPTEKYHRKDAFCFAGAYYTRYPERIQDLESFVRELPAFRPLEIYDRNYGIEDTNYRFPDNYQPYIVGTLPFEEIDKAYKGYRYAINLNSIKQSQTMFARRVYELLGSNTLTVSNFSRGVRLIFGDLVVTSDSGPEVKRRLEKLQEEGQVDRLRLAGVRKVMLEHTYGERLAYVISKISGQEHRQPLPSFKVIGVAKSKADIQRLAEHVNRQKEVDVSLSICLLGELALKQDEITLPTSEHRIKLLHAEEHNGNLNELTDNADWLVGMLPQDYYGTHYLLDIALATRYSSAKVIGKAAYHRWQDKQCKLHNSSKVYSLASHLLARRAAISASAAKCICADDWLINLESWGYEFSEQLAIDAYGYCADASSEEAIKLAMITVDELSINVGLSIKEINHLAESIAPLKDDSNDIAYLDGYQISRMLIGKTYSFLRESNAAEVIEAIEELKISRNRLIKSSLDESYLDISSGLADGKHEYIYAPKDILWSDIKELISQTEIGTLPLHMEVEPGLKLSLVVLFMNANKQRIGHVIKQPNRNQTVIVPEDTVYIRLGLRVYAGGVARVKRLLLGHLDLEPVRVFGQADTLLVTNNYPSYSDLYRNGFVHSRVLAYKESGVDVDVFRLRMDQPIEWHEFQDIDVTTGSQEALRRILKNGRYQHVLVHFLNSDMWDVLKEFIDDIKVTVWVHGAEIQSWHRRDFNAESSQHQETLKYQSELRSSFWRSVLSSMPENLYLVFVSKYLAEESMEDLGITMPEQKYSIIPNPINTHLFNFVNKGVRQRKKILSIRPYASRVYANDLTVKAILELSKEPFFEELEFKIVGDGKLFDETVKPISKFRNVCIEKGFLTQHEVAALHKEYGIFLCPSRMDTQGVSRDEAMSSGLVCITNDVGAIKEFVDDKSCLIANPESYEEIANYIKEVAHNPVRFSDLSKAASCKIEKNRSVDVVLHKELSIFS